MGFILKDDPVVLNIKLTNKGRELLSRGQLDFAQYAIGDSEIDYEFNKDISFDAYNQIMMRPKDIHPNLIYFVTKDVSGDTKQDLPTTVSTPSTIVNTAQERGFFSTGTSSGATGSSFVYTINNDIIHAKQADIMIAISGVTGGTNLLLKQAPTYGTNGNEPEVGDYLMVKWANPNLGDTIGFNVDKPSIYVWYKIEGIVSGTLAGNNLIVVVDKPVPNFNGLGGSIRSQALLYPNSNDREVSGDSVQRYYGLSFITDFVSEAVLAFYQNCDCPAADVPIWNMSIIFTEEIAGVDAATDRNYSQYYTRAYGGFLSYIERVTPTIKKIGVIHYTNKAPSNQYGEGFYLNTPRLELPTILWHHETGNTIGLTLSADTVEKTLSGISTIYRDLVDNYGNVVGKVFNDLKMFVIEDQELLFAMSYKANRNWTLPQLGASFNATSCEICELGITSITGISTSYTGASDGSIQLVVTGASGFLTYLLNGATVTGLSASFTGGTITGLVADTYNITVIDNGAVGCVEQRTVTVPDSPASPPTTTISP
jgi:hypothetical protein